MHKKTISIPHPDSGLPVEISIIGEFPPDAITMFMHSAFQQQAKNPAFLDEYNETSALIAKPTFPNNQLIADDPRTDPTAIYTFGVDTRELVFHRHEGHRVIIGIAGEAGCILRFSFCTQEEAIDSPLIFFKKMTIINIAPRRMFMLRFHGSVYHQFSPQENSTNAFFAVSVHTNEAGGLKGELLEKVLTNENSIPLLTEPAPPSILQMIAAGSFYKFATTIDMA